MTRSIDFEVGHRRRSGRGEPAVLTKMREIVTAVENNANPLWHDQPGELTADAFRPAY